MEFLKVIYDFLHLKLEETLDWGDRRLAAFKVAFGIMLGFYLMPFAFALCARNAEDATISAVFAIGLVGTMIFMLLTAYRGGKLLAAAYAAGVGFDKLFERVSKEAKKDEKSLSAAVMRTLFKGFAWMLFVGAFYAMVPMWRNFVLYVVSLAIISFASYYILGYAEETEKYRRKLFQLAVIAFMGIVMVSLGIVRFALGAGESAWKHLPSILLFDTAVAAAVIGFICIISSALSKDDAKDAFRIAGKVSLASSVALIAFVFLFGDMSWLKFRKDFSEVKAAPRAVEWTEDQADQIFGSRPGPGLGAGLDEAPPSPPAAMPPRAAGRSYEPPPSRAAKKGSSARPVRPVRKTPHQGDDLDRVTDNLDEMANRRAAVGL